MKLKIKSHRAAFAFPRWLACKCQGISSSLCGDWGGGKCPGLINFQEFSTQLGFAVSVKNNSLLKKSAHCHQNNFCARGCRFFGAWLPWRPSILVDCKVSFALSARLVSTNSQRSPCLPPRLVPMAGQRTPLLLHDDSDEVANRHARGSASLAVLVENLAVLPRRLPTEKKKARVTC